MSESTAAKSKMKYSIVNRAEAPNREGRRNYWDYLDLGLTAASGGAVRAQIICNKKGKSPPTGWHYHACQMQIVYFTKGWAELQFEDGRVHVTKPGDMVFIPGGTLHNEGESSDDMEALELSLPAEMGTINVDPPAGFSQTFGEPGQK